MSIETEEYHGFTLRVEPDEDAHAMSPRDWDNLGLMACWHDRYDLGDEQIRTEHYRDLDDLLATLVDEHEPTVMLPLYLLDHSGITMRAGEPVDLASVRLAVEGSRSAFMADPGGWDTSFVGVILDTKEGREITGVEPEHIREALNDEVELYASYLEGDVLGWVVQGPDGDVLESCWGYIGEDLDYLLGEARGAADHLRACGECEGKGYLLNQGYAEGVSVAAWIPVQQCDSCNVLSGDISAAEKALKDLGGGELRIPYNADLEIPSGLDVRILPGGGL